ncbi:MAG: MoaD/ThiS family protein [Chloroflexota bacterium]
MDIATGSSVIVHVPYALRAQLGNRRQVAASGATIRDVINCLEREYPGVKFSLCHETGELRPFVNIFLNRESIRYMQGLDTLVQPGAIVHIMHSVAGGSTSVSELQ